MDFIIPSATPHNHWVTDAHAVNGVIDLGDVDIKGSDPRCMDNREILLTVNAPNSDVIIDNLTLYETWLPFQFRNAKSITVNKYHGWDAMNDGGHFCCSNTTVKDAKYENEIKKEYNDQNHPDGFQFFSWDRKSTLSNINIPILDIYLRNTPKHGVLHWTEAHLSEKMFIGDKWMNIDTDAEEYPYWLSALVLRHSMIGNPDANVSGKQFRISDVKHTGLASYDNYFAGINSDSAILDNPDSVMFV